MIPNADINILSFIEIIDYNKGTNWHDISQIDDATKGERSRMPLNKEKERTVTNQNLQEMRQHGTKDFPLGIYLDDLSEFEEGRIPWHWHEEIQFDLVVEGQIQFQVGNKSFVLTEGQVIFINSGVLHRICPAEGSGGKLYAYVLRDCLLENDVLSAVYRKCLSPVVKGQRDCAVFSGTEENGRDVIFYLRKIRESFFQKETGYQIEVKGLLCCLWSCLLKKEQWETAPAPAREQRDMERVKRAIRYMQQHYEERLSLEDIAGELAVSRSELCRCFRRVMDVTPYEYLIQYRIRRASERLKKTDDSILEVALQCGFDSIGHMGRYFRKYCGCSPSAFRKK